MKKTILVLITFMLQGCLKTYSVAESETTTKLIVNDIYLPEYPSLLLLNSMQTVVTLQESKPACPFDGGITLKNHLGDIKLTKSESSKVINIDNSQAIYISIAITETIGSGSKVCKSSARIDPKADKNYKLSINGRECTAALYEAQNHSSDFIRSDDVAFGEFRDERMCI